MRQKYQPIHNHLTTDQTLYLEVLQPLVVAVVDRGTDLQGAQVDQAVADAQHQTVQDQIPTLDQTTVEIRITAAEAL